MELFPGRFDTGIYTPATTTSIQPNSTITGPALPEPIEVHAVTPMGTSARITGVGRRTGAPYNAVLTAEQIAALEVLTDRVPFEGDARKFRLGIEAHRLGLAHQYDPFFALSIARVDPLPHQLEAVYEYFLNSRGSDSCSPTTPVPARRSWRACSSRS